MSPRHSSTQRTQIYFGRFLKDAKSCPEIMLLLTDIKWEIFQNKFMHKPLTSIGLRNYHKNDNVNFSTNAVDVINLNSIEHHVSDNQSPGNM